MYFVYTHNIKGYYIEYSLHLENVYKRDTLYTSAQNYKY